MQQPRVKKAWKQVDGVLLLDKPLGMTSNDALQKARRLFSAAKGGHTGTLDPLATGLLPLCFGEATKFAADLLDADKVYEATLALGSETDSGDAEGEVIATAAVDLDEAAILGVLTRFTGNITQVPPMHSALKRDGRPLYELARRGEVVEREARPVVIHGIDLFEFAGTTLRLRVACSKGTYIRVLATDIGRALGCRAHLAGLRRTAVGKLSVGAAVTLVELERLEEGARLERLEPVDTLLREMPAVVLAGAAALRFSHGNPVDLDAGIAGRARVYDGARLIGIGERGADGRLWPRRLVQSVA
jgi:tRNA pseudouridine55 synthase